METDAANDFPEWLKDPVQIILAHYFDPVIRRVKLMTFDWALKNLDKFVTNIMGKHDLNDSELRLQLEEYLRFEIIFTVMQLCEDLIYFLEAYKFTNSDPVLTFKTQLKGPAFFEDCDKKETSALLDWLSCPPDIDVGESPVIMEEVARFGEFLKKARSFYFNYLSLYNCYKHGNRIAYMMWGSLDETPSPAVLYLPLGSARNEVIVFRVESVSNALELADEILRVTSVVKRNWVERRRDQSSNQWTVQLPGRKKQPD